MVREPGIAAGKSHTDPQAAEISEVQQKTLVSLGFSMRFPSTVAGVLESHVLSSHTPQAHPATQNTQPPRQGRGNVNSVILTRILHKLKQRLPSCLSEHEQLN